MDVIISIVFVIIGLAMAVSNLAVLTHKRTINRWIYEYLQDGRITSREASDLGTSFSFSYMENLCINITTKNQMKILRNTRIREKIRDLNGLVKLRNYLILALIAYVFILWLIFG